MTSQETELNTLEKLTSRMLREMSAVMSLARLGTVSESYVDAAKISACTDAMINHASELSGLIRALRVRALRGL